VFAGHALNQQRQCCLRLFVYEGIEVDLVHKNLPADGCMTNFSSSAPLVVDLGLMNAPAPLVCGMWASADCGLLAGTA
jgi:hypothetical protein